MSYKLQGLIKRINSSDNIHKKLMYIGYLEDFIVNHFKADNLKTVWDLLNNYFVIDKITIDEDFFETGGISLSRLMKKRMINIGTISAIALASKGYYSFKQGSRGFTSNMGSSDFINHYVNIKEISEDRLKNAFKKTRFGYIDSKEKQIFTDYSKYKHSYLLNVLFGPTTFIFETSNLRKILGVSAMFDFEEVSKYIDLIVKDKGPIKEAIIFSSYDDKGRLFFDEPTPYGLELAVSNKKKYERFKLDVGDFGDNAKRYFKNVSLNNLLTLDKELNIKRGEQVLKGKAEDYLLAQVSIFLSLTDLLDGKNDLEANFNRNFELLKSGQPYEKLREWRNFFG